jgi:hypothetical protein
MSKMGLLYGSGYLAFGIINSLGTVTRTIFPQLLDFMIESGSREVTASGMRQGVEIITGSANNQENYKAKIGMEDVGWTELQLGLGRGSSASTNIVVKEVKEVKIPTSGIITDPDILTVVSPAFSAEVTASIVSEDKYLVEIPSGAPTVDQVEVDRAANTLTVHSSYAGKVLTYTVTTQVATADTIGLEANPDRLNSISFTGICYGNGGREHSRISIPEMARISAPSISLGATATKLEIEYRLISQPGAELPFYLQKLYT